MDRTRTAPTAKDIADAKKVLAKHKFVPGVSNTQNLKGADRQAVKDACLVLKRADQAGVNGTAVEGA